MASQKQRGTIGLTGLNLLAAADRTEAEASVVLDNWRVDRPGELRSRMSALVEAGPVGAGVFHTLYRTQQTRYSGIGTKLYGGGDAQFLIEDGYDGNRILMAFYLGQSHAMNRGRQRILDGIVSYPWGVDAPPTAPTTALGARSVTLLEEYDGDTAANDVQASADGLNFEDLMVDDVPVASSLGSAAFDTLNKQSSTASLRITTDGCQNIATKRPFAVLQDTSIFGSFRDNDQLELWMWVSDPAQIESMAVALWNEPAAGETQGKSVECFFQKNTVWDAKGVLKQTPNSWTKVVIRRTLNIDDFQKRITEASVAAAAGEIDPQVVTDLEGQLTQALSQPTLQVIAGKDPQILGRNNTPAQPAGYFNWSEVAEMRVSFILKGPVEIRLDRAQFTGATTGASLRGSIAYFVTFDNALGQEGNPSPASIDLVAQDEPITLNDIPVSPETTVLRRRIYRIGGGLSQALQVGTIWDNTTTGPWTDPTPNEDVQNNPIFMPVDHTLPPAARGVIGPFFGKLLAYSTAAHPSRIYWTKSAQPWYFPGADEDSGQWVDAGADDDELLGATHHKRTVVFYKERTIWKVDGDIETADPVQTNSNIGVVGDRAYTNGGSVDYFVGQEGVYRFNLEYETKISKAIEPIFKGDYVRLNDGSIFPPMDPDRKHECVLAMAGDRLRLAYPIMGGGSAMLVYDTEIGRWWRETYDNLPASHITAMYWEGFNDFGRAMIAATSLDDGTGGYIVNLEQVGHGHGDYVRATGVSTPFTAVWQSHTYDQGLPDFNKVYSDLEIDFESGFDDLISTLNVYLIFDNGAKVLIGSVSSGVRTTSMLRIIDSTQSDEYGRKAKKVAVRIECSCLDNFVAVYGVYLHWYPEERVAHTFDSGPTHLGLPERAKQVDYVEMYTTASGQAIERVFHSDLPGNVLTVRDRTTFTLPNGRGTKRYRLPAIVEGRNLRFHLGNIPSSVPFQMHQLRVRFRPIGEYIDGTIGEFYESPEFAVEPGRVGELKDMALDYDASGAGGRLEVYTELPGTAMAIRRTFALPAQTTRGVYVFPFEDAADTESDGLPHGQLFKIRIYPPPGGILRLHGRAQIRARLVGVYFNGNNGEIWETQPLDLVGGLGLFREIRAVLQTSGAMTFSAGFDLPNQHVQNLATFQVNTAATTPGRLPVEMRLPFYTKGRLQHFRLAGNAIARVFSVKVLARRLEVNGSSWEWVDLPVEQTPDAWASINMPVRETPASFAWAEIPVDPIG